MNTYILALLMSVPVLCSDVGTRRNLIQINEELPFDLEEKVNNLREDYAYHYAGGDKNKIVIKFNDRDISNSTAGLRQLGVTNKNQLSFWRKVRREGVID